MATLATSPAITKGGSFLLETCRPEDIFTPADLQDDQKLIGQTAEEFITNEVLPHAHDLEDKKEGLMVSLLKKAGELGLLGPGVPEQYGGAGLDKVAITVLSEKLSGYGSFATSHGAHAGIGTVPLQSPRLAVQELERCMDQLGLQGVQIGSHVNNWNLDAPELFEFFQAASELGAAILVHPWDMMGSESMPKYWLPWLVGMPAEQSRAACSLIFGGVLERLPKLKICLAHGGGSFPYTIGRIEHGFNMRPDLVATDNPRNPREYLDRFYFDSWVADDRALRYLIDTCGVSRVMLGTDYPFPLGEQSPGAGIAALELSETEQARLYHGTALEWLGLSKSRFA